MPPSAQNPQTRIENKNHPQFGTARRQRRADRPSQSKSEQTGSVRNSNANWKNHKDLRKKGSSDSGSSYWHRVGRG